MSEIISQKEAIEQGLSRYFTGRACAHEHTAERRVSNGVCVECSRISRRAWKMTKSAKESEQLRRAKKKQQDADHRNLMRKKQRAALRALIELGIEV